MMAAPTILQPSCPRLSRAATPQSTATADRRMGGFADVRRVRPGMDGRDKPGHDESSNEGLAT